MRSSADNWDVYPVFPLSGLHVDGKTDTATCSEIIAHKSSVVGQ